jgi:hypothetical protein
MAKCSSCKRLKKARYVLKRLQAWKMQDYNSWRDLCTTWFLRIMMRLQLFVNVARSMQRMKWPWILNNAFQRHKIIAFIKSFLGLFYLKAKRNIFSTMIFMKVGCLVHGIIGNLTLELHSQSDVFYNRPMFGCKWNTMKQGLFNGIWYNVEFLVMVKINDMESVNPLPLLRFKLNMESKSHIIFHRPIHALV